MSGRKLEFDSAIRKFNHGAFTVLCRTLEVALSTHRYLDAIKLVEKFISDMKVSLITMDDDVGTCMPTRIANALHKAGYSTLARVHRAPDVKLLAIPNLQLQTIHKIRQVIDAVKAGQLTLDGSNDPEADDNMFLGQGGKSDRNRLVYVDVHVLEETDKEIRIAELQLADLRRKRYNMRKKDI